jgi:UDP-N-acetylglucosamine 2-epimerase (non-hydrolysing)
LHFAPTSWARRNLLEEGIDPRRVILTGNPVIDALRWVLRRLRRESVNVVGLPPDLQPRAGGRRGSKPRVVLITGHRRENFGAGFEHICQAIAALARRFPEVHFVYPVHLNPKVREPVLRLLGSGTSLAPATSADRLPSRGNRNIHLIEPLPYLEFVAMMHRADLILTDSGGVQEEAPGLGKPVLVMRETTERPEGVKAGTVRLVGTSRDKIVRHASRLLKDPAAYAAMANRRNPYGDGRAAPRIVKSCLQFLERQTPR